MGRARQPRGICQVNGLLLFLDCDLNPCSLVEAYGALWHPWTAKPDFSTLEILLHTACRQARMEVALICLHNSFFVLVCSKLVFVFIPVLNPMCRQDQMGTSMCWSTYVWASVCSATKPGQGHAMQIYLSLFKNQDVAALSVLFPGCVRCRIPLAYVLLPWDFLQGRL